MFYTSKQTLELFNKYNTERKGGKLLLEWSTQNLSLLLEFKKNIQQKGLKTKQKNCLDLHK